MTPHKLINLGRAVKSLQQALADPIEKDRDLGGVIKAFECAYELTWTSLKGYLKDQGHETQGAKDVFRTAWQLSILPGDDAVWFEMIGDRNLTVHTYDPAFARQLVDKIREPYSGMLNTLAAALNSWHS